MRERPILFSAAMARAVLDGRKTQTRRVVFRTEVGVHLAAAPSLSIEDGRTVARWPQSAIFSIRERCPCGALGDRLWVREPWAGPMLCVVDGALVERRFYRADFRSTDPLPHDHRGVPLKWRPSLHMSRSASRLTLEVIDVRVERLQDLSEEDALAEGVEPAPCRRGYPSGRAAPVMSYRSGFEAVWNAIDRKRPGKRAPWSSNPWVWVVEFRRADSAARESAA